MEYAILMASGLGSRMRPLTNTTPKPLIPVLDKPMIETVILGLQNRGVAHIYIVVGYLKEQFFYLLQKYENITLITNEVYETVNNISSAYAAREVLKQGDCFICEADLYVEDASIFCRTLEQSCYYGKFVKGYSADWVFEQNSDGRITRVGKGGTDCYNMTGIAFFKNKEALKLYRALEQEYGKPGYEELFWDDVVNQYLDEIELIVEPVLHDQIVEIDTVGELQIVKKQLEEKRISSES